MKAKRLGGVDVGCLPGLWIEGHVGLGVGAITVAGRRAFALGKVDGNGGLRWIFGLEAFCQDELGDGLMGGIGGFLDGLELLIGAAECYMGGFHGVRRFWWTVDFGEEFSRIDLPCGSSRETLA